MFVIDNNKRHGLNRSFEMLQAERHRLICSHVSQHGSALVRDLAQLCHVSQETIRRDLTVLEREKRLIRSFGGAVATEQDESPVLNVMPSSVKLSQMVDGAESFRKRTEENPDAKMKIAKAALKFIQPGDCIMMDNSSTCWFLARQIPDIDITVVTNSVKIIQALACRDRVRVIGIGGEYSERHDDFHGPISESIIRSFQIKTLFLSCQGFNIETGVRDGSEVNAKLKNIMIQVSENCVLLADNNKLDQYAFSQVCTLNDINVLITNKLNDKNFKQVFPKLNIIECDK
ncbi:DeoR family transcriptional regulator [Providencia sp. wls1922]|jgi:DeoR family L-fucose operon activator|nr:DeoR family transcriptional regulator [Providencia sp. wls1950]MTC23572.1 DeoR family transcriptional regulator [Providencia sp. wls1938]MTC45105.1 DeoR family transcriptional regulator [Providencia sp. wls1922]MTC79135.1 DeoR family transcriptional regulator [Providencia sp. wls1916]